MLQKFTKSQCLKPVITRKKRSAVGVCQKRNILRAMKETCLSIKDNIYVF